MAKTNFILKTKHTNYTVYKLEYYSSLLYKKMPIVLKQLKQLNTVTGVFYDHYMLSWLVHGLRLLYVLPVKLLQFRPEAVPLRESADV